MFKVIHVKKNKPVTYISKFAICLSNVELGDRDIIVVSAYQLKHLIEEQIARFGASDKNAATVQKIMNELTLVKL